MPSNKLAYTANFGADVFASQKGVLADLWGHQINNISVPTLVSVYTKLMEFLLDNPSIGSGGFWLLEKFGSGVTASVPDSSTAYPWRTAVGHGFFEFNFQSNVSSKDVKIVDKFAKELRLQLTQGCGNPDGNVYVNYARGDEKPAQMYGASKLPRLRALKSKYDPYGLFNQYNPFIER